MGKTPFRTLIVINILLVFGIVVWHISIKGSSSGFSEAEATVNVPFSQVISGEPIVLEQDDERILNYIWEKHYIIPPSEFDYNLEKPKKDPSSGQGQFIRKILRNMTEGFFVEAGALDGETRSNTLYMEQHLKWKGLLVEGDPSNFKILKSKNRKAWSSNTCLAIKPYPHTVEFLQHFNIGKIITNTTGVSKQKRTKVQCMPLFSLLSALNILEVDYFSLDVEGNELDVLKTIPFDKVFIKTLSVEYEHTPGGKKGIVDFMTNNGYKLAGEVNGTRKSWALDVIFVHKNVQLN